MMLKHTAIIRNLVLAILLVAAGASAGFRYGKTGTLPGIGKPPFAAESQTYLYNVTNTDQPVEFKDVDFQQFWEVWKVLEQTYIEQGEINKEAMVHGAIRGMTQAIGDPYTSYLPPEDNQRAEENLNGAFYGVGIQLGYIDSTLAVIAPLEGTPADAAGVQAGDLILHVKDESKDIDEDSAGWSLSEAVANIRGKRGTTVTLTLYRRNNGNEPFEVDISRDEIIVPSVELVFEEQAEIKVAHLQVRTFGERTEAEWEAAVQQILREPNLSGIVLDLRNNPGGLFDVSVDLASDFIENDLVVSQKGRYANQDFNSSGPARLKDIPMVILVNKGSASASEILAGALRDQTGAILIGEKTFGKGTVQDRQVLSNHGALHVTVARWLLPSGEWIHEEGIPVSVEVTDDPETEQDEPLQRAIEVLRDRL